MTQADGRSRIILIRHGQSAIALRPRTGHAGFAEYIDAYEAAGLDPESLPPEELRDLVRELDAVFASDRPRSTQSARVLAPHADLVVDPLFAEAPDRRGTGSEKWDRYADRDVLPMWVADMDFPAPAEVLTAIHDRVDHGVFGYTHEPPGFAEALAGHLERRHGWRVDPGRIVATPGVVTGLAITARLLADPGAEILTFTPMGPVLAVRPYCNNTHYWQVYFDTNRVIRETFGEAGFPAPEQHFAVRSGARNGGA